MFSLYYVLRFDLAARRDQSRGGSIPQQVYQSSVRVFAMVEEKITVDGIADCTGEVDVVFHDY